MSRLDFPSQAMPRSADAQTRGTPTASDPHEGSEAASRAFESFLNDVSGKSQADDASASQGEASRQSPDAGGSVPGTTPTDSDFLNSLLTDPSLAANGVDTTASQTGSSAFSIIEGLLPRILTQAGGAGTADTGARGQSLASPFPSTPQQELSGSDLMSPASGPKLAVSVQNQETHFKPVIEALEAGSTDMLTTATNGEANRNAEGALPRTSGQVFAENLHSARSDVEVNPVAHPNVEMETSEGAEANVLTRRMSAVSSADRAETSHSPAIGGARTEGASLPSATLQQIAGAVIADVGRSGEVHQSASQADGLNRVALARASGSVLRVLSLQLKPVELGLVTITMRLAGDGLEMEIQAESEDTAELLRSDTEKLSNLLRASGYRPDIINIQSIEASSHDRSSSQRLPQGPHAQGQSFDQGAGAGQGHSSGRQDERYGRSGRGDRSDRGEIDPSRGSHAGGIYL